MSLPNLSKNSPTSFCLDTRLNGWGFKRIESGTSNTLAAPPPLPVPIDVNWEELTLVVSPNIQVVTTTSASSEAYHR